MNKLALVILIAVLAIPSAASASGRQMEVAMQDDLTILNTQHNRDLALIQFAGMGGTHVRITIDHVRTGRLANSVSVNATTVPLNYIDAAVNRVVEFGLTPQITLFWKDQDDKYKLADWMYNIAEHLGARVNRYSVYNEADLYMPELHKCTEERRAELVEKFPNLVELDGDKYRAKVKTKGGTIPLQRACLRYERGLNYKKIFRPAAKSIREANPGADILAGETSALRGLDWFFRGANARRLPADGWAHHPFQFTDLHPERPANNWGIGNLKMLRRAVRMPVYLTEFGYPRPNSTMDKRLYGRHLTDQDIATVLPRAWSVARKGGAKQMLQFQWFQKSSQFSKTDYWDTALNRRDDGSVTPQFFALRTYICTWSNRCP
jgi:hypothetical protein